jgi:hypothetical protein
MAGLAILKHMHDLSDKALCERWVENPFFQFFCGEEFFQHELTIERSLLTRWRQRMGEERLASLVQESLTVAVKTGAAKPAAFTRVIFDTTVQEKAIYGPSQVRRARRRASRRMRRGGHRRSPAAHRCRRFPACMALARRAVGGLPHASRCRFDGSLSLRRLGVLANWTGRLSPYGPWLRAAMLPRTTPCQLCSSGSSRLARTRISQALVARAGAQREFQKHLLSLCPPIGARHRPSP